MHIWHASPVDWFPTFGRNRLKQPFVIERDSITATKTQMLTFKGLRLHPDSGRLFTSNFYAAWPAAYQATAARLSSMSPARPSCPPAQAKALTLQMQADTDLETALLGPVLGDRTCGDCTVCCTVLKVDTPEFKKRAGTPCVHLGPRGCSIHAVHPRICRTWFCAWRRVASMPSQARPDLSGLLVSVNFVREPQNCFEGVSINVRLLAGSKAIEDGIAAKVLDSLCDQLVPVWFSDGSKKILMHPDNEIAQHVISGTPAPAQLQDEVQAWREYYGLFAPPDQT